MPKMGHIRVHTFTHTTSPSPSMKTSILSSFLALVIVASAPAASLIYESFTGPGGGASNDQLGGTTTGTGLSGSWVSSGGSTFTTESLSYGDLAHTGSQANITASKAEANATTEAGVLGSSLDDGGTLWFSVMYSGTSNGGNEATGFGFGTENFSSEYNGLYQGGTGNGVGFYKSSGTWKANYWTGGGNRAGLSSSGISYTASSSVFLVGKAEWGATNADNHTFTLYSPSTTDLGTLGTGVSVSFANFDQSALDTVGFGAKDFGTIQTFDEIRFGASYADVSPVQVPEPSAALLCGLGALLLLRRRRAS